MDNYYVAFRQAKSISSSFDILLDLSYEVFCSVISDPQIFKISSNLQGVYM